MRESWPILVVPFEQPVKQMALRYTMGCVLPGPRLPLKADGDAGHRSADEQGGGAGFTEALVPSQKLVPPFLATRRYLALMNSSNNMRKDQPRRFLIFRLGTITSSTWWIFGTVVFSFSSPVTLV